MARRRKPKTRGDDPIIRCGACERWVGLVISLADDGASIVPNKDAFARTIPDGLRTAIPGAIWLTEHGWRRGTQVEGWPSDEQRAYLFDDPDVPRLNIACDCGAEYRIRRPDLGAARTSAREEQRDIRLGEHVG